MGTGLRGVGKVIRGQIKQSLLGKRFELFSSLKWEAIEGAEHMRGMIHCTFFPPVTQLLYGSEF